MAVTSYGRNQNHDDEIKKTKRRPIIAPAIAVRLLKKIWYQNYNIKYNFIQNSEEKRLWNIVQSQKRNKTEQVKRVKKLNKKPSWEYNSSVPTKIRVKTTGQFWFLTREVNQKLSEERLFLLRKLLPIEKKTFQQTYFTLDAFQLLFPYFHCQDLTFSSGSDQKLLESEPI